MNVLDKSLHDLTAADLMSRQVVTVPKGMSLRSAAWLLTGARVTGAPVVDAWGRCVGVLSNSDFLKLAGERVQMSGGECVCCEWQVMEISQVPEDSVELYMTRDPVTVAAETPLSEVARRMLDAHIHRVIVVDDKQRPVGVVSTTDIIAAVAARDAREEP